jgi:hypothetical protein
MTTTETIVLVVGLMVIAALAWYLIRERRSKKLRSRFGPEYEHAVREYGNQSSAEAALRKRADRVERFQIRTLSPQEQGDFATRWKNVQARFVDDPAGSISDADKLVNDLMKEKGYPMANFEHRAEDLSVDHPLVVRNYRAAHAIAMRHEQGEAGTEDLRQAIVNYRDLFDELLEARTADLGKETLK